MQPTWRRVSYLSTLLVALARGASFHRAHFRGQQIQQPGSNQILVKERLYPKIRETTTLDPIVAEHKDAGAGQGGVVRHRTQHDYNEETDIAVPWDEESSLPFSCEAIIAVLWITLVASLPIAGILLEGKNITKTQLTQFVVMWIVFFGGVYLFTNVLYFQSVHFETIRRLTIVEAVYLMSQILTTVGYGDITPAKPRGQVFVALYVLFSLLVLANVFSECTEIITARAKSAIADFKKRANDARALVTQEDPEDDGIDTRKFFDKGPPTLDFSGLYGAGGFYIFMVICGVLFFHNYPGEGKTWFQGVYMSVITLSTVGFGAFTPVTEGGKVFGAFWMLFGCAALAALIGNFTDVFVQMKIRERYKPEVKKAEMKYFFESLPDDTDRLTFFKQSLIHKKLVDEDVIEEVSAYFRHLSGSTGKLTRSKIDRHMTEAEYGDEDK
jgi:hypothetical protein